MARSKKAIEALHPTPGLFAISVSSLRTTPADDRTDLEPASSL
jgi:hypothetical protein